MTEPLYLPDPYRREFEATVERVVGDRVALDRTAFYPEGGGQPADRGTLEAVAGGGSTSDPSAGRSGDDGTAWDVLDVEKKDTIYHELDGDPPEAGTTVAGRLDWARRYGHMRHHTAQHLLSAVLLAEFDAPTVGNQLYRDRARIDVERDRFTDEDLAAIAVRMNELIDAGMDVRWYEMDRETAERELDTGRTRIDLLPDGITELRIVEIGPAGDPYDRTACAGTHVENTGELGRFEVTGRETKGSGQERLSFALEE